MKWTGTKHCEEGSNAIIQPAHPRLFRAVRAAEKLAIRLRAVADHLAVAVRARRCQCVDGAFKASNQCDCPPTVTCIALS